MKVCVVTPPSDFLIDERVFVSLGILKVAASLEQAGHEVEHMDLNGVTEYEEVARNYDGATTFAITATTPQMPAAVKLSNILRQKGRVIIGGPHVTLVNAAAKRTKAERAIKAMALLQEHFDCVVAGDGEQAIFRAIEPGCNFIDADQPSSDLWQTSKNFADSPWPARHLVDISSYNYTIDGSKALSMISQLGCPFECGFCGGRFSPMLRRIRTRPSDNVVAELRHLNEAYGVQGMMFLDDELNVNKGLVGLMQEISKTGIDWRFRGFVKAELFTEEQAKAMYAAGFRWLLCGFESAHHRILKNINKKATLEDNTRMLRTAHAAGIKVKALMSFGHPGESEETILATRDWLLTEKPDDFDCTVITVYPGTPYYDLAQPIEPPVFKYEINGDALYSEDVNFLEDQAYYKGRSGEYRAFVWTDYLTRERLAALRDAVEDEVRTKLGIPWPTAQAGIQYEASMGQIPNAVLRRNSER